MQRCIFLSPHLDDAVLSCGGLVAKLSKDAIVEIWTLFTGAPWCGPYSNVAKWLHGVSGGRTGSRLVKQRRREDLSACRVLGTGFRHFGWRDSVYRKTGWKRFLYPHTCQAEIDSADHKLVKAMTRQLQRSLASDDLVFVPLALGGHVDHRIVRAAAEAAVHSQVTYYSEIPYLQRYPEQIATCTYDLRSLACQLDVADVKVWTTAVACYQSQLSMLEAGSIPIATLLEEYHSKPLTLYVPLSKRSTSASESLLSHLNWQDQDEDR